MWVSEWVSVGEWKVPGAKTKHMQKKGGGKQPWDENKKEKKGATQVWREQTNLGVPLDVLAARWATVNLHLPKLQKPQRGGNHAVSDARQRKKLHSGVQNTHPYTHVNTHIHTRKTPQSPPN